MEGQKRIEDIILWINKELLKDSKKANDFKKIIPQLVNRGIDNLDLSMISSDVKLNIID